MKSKPISVRVRTTTESPPIATAIITLLANQCTESGRQWMHFSIDDLPMTVNHQYKHTRFSTYLRPEVRAFRSLVLASMGSKRLTWKPLGVTAAVVLFQSPYWVTKQRTVREMDVDNRVKPLLDAVQEATGHADERHWQVHLFKVPSKRVRTTVYLFDLGDVVDFYY